MIKIKTIFACVWQGILVDKVACEQASVISDHDIDLCMCLMRNAGVSKFYTTGQ